MDLLSISRLRKLLHKLKGYWQRADIPGKMLIMLFFAPSLFVLIWLLSEIAYIIVFELPLFIIKVFAKIFLFCVFWSAAVYFYEKLHSIMTNKTTDDLHTEETQNMEEKETKKEKKVRWSKKDTV
jgi:predicted membrane protein